MKKRGVENHEPGSNESLDLDSQMRRVFGRISEMDIAKRSDLRTAIYDPIKNCTDASGKVVPYKLDYLEKRVNEIYFGKFLPNQEVDREAHENPERYAQKYFAIPMPDRGYYGMAYLNIYDKSKNGIYVMETKEVGNGYTTTADRFPDWLDKAFIKIGKGVVVEESGDFNSSYSHASVVSEQKAMFQDHGVMIRNAFRTHENSSGCEANEYIFEDKDGLESFRHFLFEQSKLSATDEACQKLLPFLFRHFSLDINWSAMDMIAGRRLRLRVDSEKLLKSEKDVIEKWHEAAKHAIQKKFIEESEDGEDAAGIMDDVNDKFLSAYDKRQKKLKEKIQKIPWTEFVKIIERMNEKIVEEIKEKNPGAILSNG
ncbi:MAG: hypothetical protein WCJ29_02565 [bacterium]